MKTSWLTDEEQRLWRTYLVVSHEVDAELDRQLQADSGIAHTYYGILVALSESAKGTARMGELAAVLTFSTSRLTHAVKAMEKQGWVTRQPCPHDKRGQLATITEAGRAALVAAAPGHVTQVRRLMFDGIDADDLAAFGRVLEVIRQRLERDE